MPKSEKRKASQRRYENEKMSVIRVKLYGEKGIQLVSLVDSVVKAKKQQTPELSRNQWVIGAIVKQLVDDGIPIDEINKLLDEKSGED